MLDEGLIALGYISNTLSQRVELKKLVYKIKEMGGITDLYKKNRWFGYCQHMGQKIGLWTLYDIIERVRAEND